MRLLARNGARVSLEQGREYWIRFSCRDIGHGVEEGDGDFAYAGVADYGKCEFRPAGDGEPIYLFPDEITDIEEV